MPARRAMQRQRPQIQLWESAPLLAQERLAVKDSFQQIGPFIESAAIEGARAARSLVENIKAFTEAVQRAERLETPRSSGKEDLSL